MRVLAISLLCIASVPTVARAEDPCSEAHARSLVMSGGGAKGAFEAGAAYHVIVHRGCDFAELAGNSVGAINGALLAQAAAATDAASSLANLQEAAENLVDEWTAIGGSRDMMRTRPLGRMRFALLGLDSVANMEPLRQFIRERVSLAKLASGRELRIGFTTFVDGRYREIVLNAGGRVDPQTAHELILGSTVVPVFGRMVRLAPSASGDPLEIADGGLRHATPVTSYFSACSSDDQNESPECLPMTGAGTPPHPHTEQLFVIVTSPFARRDDSRPMVDARAFDRRGGITDGRQILVRMVDLLVDTMYRDDLDDLLTYNELLAWHDRAVAAGAPLPAFPLGSYNVAATEPSRSLPYEIVIVAPQREDADPLTIFNLDPATQRRQLFCGCIAADEAMTDRFGLTNMADQCIARFPGLRERDEAEVSLAPAVCRDEHTAVGAPTAAH